MFFKDRRMDLRSGKKYVLQGRNGKKMKRNN